MRLCVATTHILYNPKRGDCKLAQLQVLLANLDRLAFKGSQIDSCVNEENRLVPIYYPTVLCGDFNCVNNSDLYKFLIESKLENYKCLNRNVMSGQFQTSRNAIQIERALLPEHLGISDQCQFEEEVKKRLNDYLKKKDDEESSESGETETELCLELRSKCSFGSENLSHFFNFKSVYNHYDDQNRYEVTTCVQDFKKTVDYIFYHSNENQQNLNEIEESKLDLKLLARLELFTEDKVQDIILPDKNYPSDHFLLAGKFICDS
jgi:protein angel